MRWSGDPRRLRWIVVALAVLSTSLKLGIASQTFGTNGVLYWSMFAQGVRQHGPLGIYGLPPSAFYNHPPLAGWMLSGPTCSSTGERTSHS